MADLCGKPLICYSIEAALKSRIFKRVVVTTDSEQIGKVALTYEGVELIHRDPSLAKDTTPTFPVIEDVLQSAKIFHYNGPDHKPWRNLSAARTEVWWRYARRTPFYEKLLCMVMQVEANKVKSFIFEQRKIPSLKRKARLLSILRLFTFGKTRQRLKEKREKIRKRIETLEKT